jgi:hypothetical protein
MSRATLTALAWLGRQGTRGIAALIFIALALPPLDRLLKPYVAEAVFVLLCLAFLRVAPAAMAGHVARPTVVLAATAWTMLVIPTLFGLVCLATGLPTHAPDLLLALMLQGMASPMMASPALAALMGLDAPLVLATLVVSSALVAVTAPLFAFAFIGSTLGLSPVSLGLRLSMMLAGSAVIGIVTRRLVGAERITRCQEELDGLNILFVFVFVASVMENVVAHVLTTPWVTIALAGVALMSFGGVLALTALAFAWLGQERALSLALMAAQRNMGLMVAATGGALPELTWLYLAMSQFPIYLSPRLLEPFARRVTSPAMTAATHTEVTRDA